MCRKYGHARRYRGLPPVGLLVLEGATRMSLRGSKNFSTSKHLTRRMVMMVKLDGCIGNCKAEMCKAVDFSRHCPMFGQAAPGPIAPALEAVIGRVTCPLLGRLSTRHSSILHLPSVVFHGKRSQRHSAVVIYQKGFSTILVMISLSKRPSIH